MKVVNEVLLTADDFQRLLGAGIEGSVTIVGLLKFRDRAAYPDGRETGLTGAEAYGLFRRELIRRATSAGGRLVHSGPLRHLLLGEVEEPWDEVFIVEYPSVETFVDVLSLLVATEYGDHRRAGLAAQLLFATTPGSDGSATF